MTPWEWDQNLAMLRPRGFLIYNQNWAAFARHYLFFSNIVNHNPSSALHHCRFTLMELLNVCQCQGEFPKHHLVPAFYWFWIRCSKLHCLGSGPCQIISSSKPLKEVQLAGTTRHVFCLSPALLWFELPGCRTPSGTQSTNAGRWLNLTPLLHIKQMSHNLWMWIHEFSNKRLTSVPVEEFTL